jgi:ATP-dependent DNA helicase 2 subunit 2
MRSVLPDVEKACSMLLQKKLIYNKYDEVGIVVFGTEETGNELAREIGGYENVTVLRNIRVVDELAAEHVKQLPRGTVAGDCILLASLPLIFTVSLPFSWFFNWLQFLML